MTAELVAATAPEAEERAVEVLQAGGIVAIPTETVYGLAVLPSEDALTRLVAAKRRSSEKGVAVLIDSVDQIGRLAIVPGTARRLAEHFWPGPLTLVLPLTPGVKPPDTLTGGRSTIGFRLPDHEAPRRLARRLGPIAASSANISGEPDATTAEAVITTLGDVVDLVVDGGPVRGGIPSTVVSVDADGAIEVLREGALSTALIRSVTG